MQYGDHLFLVDGSSYIFRAYHAMPPLTRQSDGLPTGAVSGFCNMLWKLLSDVHHKSLGIIPSHFAVIFDHSATTFRNQIYSDYKSKRDSPPEDLRSQFQLIRKATEAFNIPYIEKDGYEADDIIATYAKQVSEIGGHLTIISSDKDFMQLVGPHVTIFDAIKGLHIGYNEVVERFSVGPEKFIDLQALAGDSSDNIPGVPGIGLKIAAQLLKKYNSLEEILERASEIKQKKRRENLMRFSNLARLSKKLVTLNINTPLDSSLETLILHPIDPPKLISFLKDIELNTLTKRVAKAMNVDESIIMPRDHFFNPRENGNFFLSPDKMASLSVETQTYETICNENRLKLWINEAENRGIVSLDTETNSSDAMHAVLVGLSLSTTPGRACYIPLTHNKRKENKLESHQIPMRKAIALLKPLLESPRVLKIAQNIKDDWILLSRYGIIVSPFDDIMLLSYVLDAGRSEHSIESLSKSLLSHTPISFKDIVGKGRSLLTFDQVPIDKATIYAAENADLTLRLWLILKSRLSQENFSKIYDCFEHPLVNVLGHMEKLGICVDQKILLRFSGELAEKIKNLEDEIYEKAGMIFNLSSSKQISKILFVNLKLPSLQKTKTGQWSTSSRVLESLSEAGYDLPSRIIEWRKLTKLKSTYVDGLLNYINPRTQRVHTSYSMASTMTGRLASSEPNLQNIPIRTKEGRKIRRAFVSGRGNKLISADYSQIELRILAHIGNITRLKQAFLDGVDVHAMIASEIFNVPIDKMDPMIRRQAKAINFGIIYGISAFGLANNLNISYSEASDYIKMYFKRFPGIQAYIEDTKSFCREHGYVENIFGRRIHYPEIQSSNAHIRTLNERAAINAPIQSSAADIIRRAMVKMETALISKNLKAEMLLQVHDELIFEVPNLEVESTIKVVCSIMENAPMPILRLKVPLLVDAKAAKNWAEAH
ncbi:DNA polymerase I [Candidatus Endowatersipora endosymbiont of Watersipora subatra]|uniref:DNA polymerase I n=1 Tax=Candidatus Endowatersipora endosymbiont of Watersipora subatra TaxID=3077946 RepID=UPI00312CB3B4